MKKLRGGQPKTWHKVIERDLHSINLTTKDAIKLASDRDVYQCEVVTHVKDKAVSDFFPETESELETESD